MKAEQQIYAPRHMPAPVFEAVALSFLRGRAKTYNEPFTVNLAKFDGTVATISNQ